MNFLDNLDKTTLSTDFEIMLSEIENFFNVHITIHDYSGILFHLDGKRLFPERNYHLCPFCLAGRFTEPKWRQLCVKDCMIDSDYAVLQEARPFIKNCWKGVMELVIPIFRHKKIMAAVYIGGFKGKIPLETKLPSKYLKMHKNLPEIPDDASIQKLKSAITILIQGMIGTVEYVIEQEMDAEFGRKFKIYRFIQENAHRKVKLEDLAQHLYLSSSRTGHLVSNLFKKNFTELLIQERMLRAKSLLLNDWLSIEDVATTVGFKNVYYFNSAFKKQFGIPPGRFRNKYLA